MAGNSAFELVTERGWRRGLGNMLRSEFAHWWQTRLWWVQCLIWAGIVGFMLGAILFSSDGLPGDDIVVIYTVFSGLFPAVGVVIIMQDAVVGEKQDGTAAWVLSKPIARQAFILAKLVANSLGVLVTMVLVPGVVAFSLYALATGNPWDLGAFILVLGVLFSIQIFFLTLTLMLGTFFNGRGPVIGIALALLFMQQYLVGMVPALGYVLPWNLMIPSGALSEALIPSLLLGYPAQFDPTVAIILLESLLFVGIGMRRFAREEF